MDANELNALLEDVRDFMAMLKTGERAYVDTLTATAKENKFAAKAIGHIIEQQLLKGDPAHKIGALLLIDSICQNVGEPYISYFSTNIGKMFGEVWKSSGPATRERMMRWIRHYETKHVFPPEAIQAMKNQIAPGTGSKSKNDQQTVARADPRRARMTAPPSAPAVPMTSAQPPVSVPVHHPAYGIPPPPSQSWTPATQAQVPSQQFYSAQQNLALPPDPLQQYRAVQQQAANTASLPYQAAYPPRPPLSSSFRGVRLQEYYPEAHAYLHHATNQLRVHLNDKRIARERARRERKAATARGWYAPADMWAQGAAGAEMRAPAQLSLQEEEVAEEEVHFTVLKDDAQPRCAICNEPFVEEWDSEQQEWVYTKAVRLPPFAAAHPDVTAEAGKIVKINVLPIEIVEELEKREKERRKKVKRAEAVASGKRKRKADWDAEDDRRAHAQPVA